MSKVLAVLPVAALAAAENLAVHAPPIEPNEDTRTHLETVRVATEARHRLRFAYTDLKEQQSERLLRPLGCFYWGSVWTLAGWCESREAFRSFRVDRISLLQVLDERFCNEKGKTLADLLRQVKLQTTEGPGA